ncbi:olfactory receptor 5B21-like isoform X1 [Alligator sinensis]|uniref:Olfactory receptor n=2 Tax=Alligator sinensis TaxID=38654 RepID=A0A1U7RYS7_ALLSI|nr:olfactory receptor 5B21-like isoform X1 [Alligator sinensis]XP_006031634.1 olfactory receptor 5B21-like isoform X1 [Alligator sinensis]
MCLQFGHYLGKENQTTEFILLGLSSDPQLQILLFCVFLVIYLITLAGNAAIMLVIRADSHLHTPMYFFLSHLSIVDICYSSVTVPKMLANLLATHKSISVSLCFTQMFFILLSGTCELSMLSAMAYDRYAAICSPLHYARTMNKRVCRQLVGGSWTIGLMYSLVNTVPVFKLQFCGSNKIGHFSCELPPLLAISCSGTFTNKIALLSSAVTLGIGTFLLTLVSYIHIIFTILRIRSAEGRRKTISTCSSHLIVVGLWYTAGFLQYMKPSSSSSVILDQVFSIQYSILTPMLNPIIYSLKNKEVKTALGRIFKQKIKFSTHVNRIQW